MYLFDAAGLLNAQTLLNKAADTAADLELQLPPLNAPLVFQRIILELAMPQVSACSLSTHTSRVHLMPNNERLSARVTPVFRQETAMKRQRRYIIWWNSLNSMLRPYHPESTPSRPIREVKLEWAQLVLG